MQWREEVVKKLEELLIQALLDVSKLDSGVTPASQDLWSLLASIIDSQTSLKENTVKAKCELKLKESLARAIEQVTSDQCLNSDFSQGLHRMDNLCAVIKKFISLCSP